MKNYKDLTQKEKEKLASIMLEVIYGVQNKPVPKPLEDIDITRLIDSCNFYLDRIAKGSDDEDDPHYIYETVMSVIYGDDIWKFLNSCRK